MNRSSRFARWAATSAVVLASSVAAAHHYSARPTCLESAVDIHMVKYHQYVLSEIAKQNNGNRAAGTPGHDRSVEYVAHWLKSAGYIVTTQEFEFPYFQELSDPVLSQVTPSRADYPPNTAAGFLTASYSGAGDSTSMLQPVDVLLPIGDNPPNSSTSGCEPADFAGFMPGNIAMIQRGSCTFATKVANAESAGASGVIIFNEGQPDRIDAFPGTLGGPGATIPVVIANYHIAEELYGLMQAGSQVQVHISANVLSEMRNTRNLIAESPEGDDTHTVLVGAHLDSALEGPGINDNGSGSAAVLEVACRMGWLRIRPRFKVRFAFWSAEERGLLGSAYYVANLSEEELSKISLNLNFDMLASKNYVRFVYDGDGSDTPVAGPPGSDVVEKLFVDYFSSLGLPTDPAAMDNRSDYAPFAEAGIPVGGLFAGADALKTQEQVQKYGGTVEAPSDECYHTPCDDVDNLDYTIEEQLLRAIAHAIGTYSQEQLTVPQPNKSAMLNTARSASVAPLSAYRGPWAVR